MRRRVPDRGRAQHSTAGCLSLAPGVGGRIGVLPPVGAAAAARSLGTGGSEDVGELVDGVVYPAVAAVLLLGRHPGPAVVVVVGGDAVVPGVAGGAVARREEVVALVEDALYPRLAVVVAPVGLALGGGPDGHVGIRVPGLEAGDGVGGRGVGALPVVVHGMLHARVGVDVVVVLGASAGVLTVGREVGGHAAGGMGRGVSARVGVARVVCVTRHGGSCGGELGELGEELGEELEWDVCLML